jgi:hypothetical protein
LSYPLFMLDGMRNGCVWGSVSVPVVVPDGWSRDAIVASMGELERLRGELDAAFALLVVGLGVVSRDAVAQVARVTRVSTRNARQRVAVAEVVTKIPGAVEALASGGVRAEHLAALHPVVDDPDAHGLLEVAAGESVDAFRKSVTRFQIASDPGSFRKRQRDSRSVSFFDAEHGNTGIRIVLTPLEGEEFRNRLQQIADAHWREKYPERAHTLGGHDAEPLSRRLADGFMAMVRGDGAGLGVVSGKPVFVVTVNAETLETEIAGTGPVALADVMDCFDRAEFYAAIRDTKGEILRFGRGRRFASAMQKLALTVRDGGCVWEGCTAHWSKTDAHHMIEYDHGGKTDLEHLVRLCKAHHQHLHVHNLRIRRVNGQLVVEPDPDADTEPAAA